MNNNNLLPPDMTVSSSHNRYLIFPSFNLFSSLSDYKGFKTVILRVWHMCFHEYLKYLTMKDKTGGIFSTLNICLKGKHMEDDKPEWKHEWISSGKSESINTQVKSSQVTIICITLLTMQLCQSRFRSVWYKAGCLYISFTVFRRGNSVSKHWQMEQVKRKDVCELLFWVAE